MLWPRNVFLFRHSTLFRAVQSRRVTARGTNQSHNKWVSCNQMDLILLWLLSISTCEVFATAVPLANAVKCTWNCSVTQKIAFVVSVSSCKFFSPIKSLFKRLQNDSA